MSDGSTCRELGLTPIGDSDHWKQKLHVSECELIAAKAEIERVRKLLRETAASADAAIKDAREAEKRADEMHRRAQKNEGAAERLETVRRNITEDLRVAYVKADARAKEEAFSRARAEGALEAVERLGKALSGR